jgi:hypothetical protein
MATTIDDLSPTEAIRGNPWQRRGVRRMTALVATLIGVALTAPAFASNPVSFTGGEAVTGMTDESISAPAFTDSVALDGTMSASFNLFTINPGSACTGSHCSGGLVTESLTVNFSNLEFGLTPIANFSLTGTYTAKYGAGSSELSCAMGDGKSPNPGATDCFAWTGATNVNYNGVLVIDKSIGGGKMLELTLANATDWSITPTATARVVNAPEPISLAVFGSGLLGLGLARRRNRA